MIEPIMSDALINYNGNMCVGGRSITTSRCCDDIGYDLGNSEIELFGPVYIIIDITKILQSILRTIFGYNMGRKLMQKNYV